MQKKWLAVALVSALVCSAATAVQAEVKIGVVSTEVILRDSAAAQAASKKLEQESRVWQNLVNKKLSTL